MHICYSDINETDHALFSFFDSQNLIFDGFYSLQVNFVVYWFSILSPTLVFTSQSSSLFYLDDHSLICPYNWSKHTIVYESQNLQPNSESENTLQQHIDRSVKRKQGPICPDAFCQHQKAMEKLSYLEDYSEGGDEFWKVILIWFF